MIQEIIVIDDKSSLLTLNIRKSISEKMEQIRVTKKKTSELMEVLKNIPTLIIINEDELEFNIKDVIRLIKNDDDNAITPIIVVSSNSSKKHKMELLQEQILYYVRTPIEPEYVYHIIKNVVDLLYINRRISPLTGLPGNVQIKAETKKRLLKKEVFAILYLDLDNFKSYNDIYGFAEGDRIIKTTGKVITNNIYNNEKIEDAFVGHIGGDDFVALVSKTNYEKLCQDILKEFEDKIPEYFNKEDLEKGYLEVPNRSGVMEKFPLTSLSIGVVEILPNTFKNVLEIGEIGAQVKKKAKQITGNSYYINKREIASRR
ncbi:MAG: diguanylate cyclase domain-containing protein [Clostridium sp.]